MPKATPLLTNFTAGEWAPTLEGRIDQQKYGNACRQMRNMYPLLHGPVQRRAGTRFVQEAHDSSVACRLLSFEFSTEQAYVLEFGDATMRVFMDRGIVETAPDTPLVVTSPYAAADLFALRTAQSADVLYIVHPDYAPRTLTRTSHTSWTFAELSLQDGPYLPVNVSATTMTPGALSGSTTMTASAATFASTDVGRVLRYRPTTAADWGWARITGFTSATVVDITWHASPGGSAGASTEWRLCVWSDTTGWPTTVTFFQDRLCFAGAAGSPQRIDMSRSGDYTAFAPTDPDGSVADDHAVGVTLNASNVNAVRWLADDEKGLLAGSVGGEWIVRPSSLGEAITPANVQGARSTNFGSADVAPLRIGRAVLYVQRARRRLREHAFVFEDDGFRSPDVSILAEHLISPGVVEMVYQQEPSSIVWVVRVDGRLLGLTYVREQDVLGWHLHTLGGHADAGDTTPAAVESIATIPSPSGDRDELWLVVRRHIDGATVRYVEYMEAPLAEGGEGEDAFYVDAGLTYDGAAADTITGLDHLEGETVSVLADGATHPDVTVSGGAISLEREAAKVQVGLGYAWLMQTMNIEAGSASGTAQGKTKRLHRCIVRLRNTLGATAGPDETTLDPIPQTMFRPASVPMDQAVPLFSGDADLAWPGGYESFGRVTIGGSLPLPAMVVSITPFLITQDR